MNQLLPTTKRFTLFCQIYTPRHNTFILTFFLRQIYTADARFSLFSIKPAAAHDFAITARAFATYRRGGKKNFAAVLEVERNSINLLPPPDLARMMYLLALINISLARIYVPLRTNIFIVNPLLSAASEDTYIKNNLPPVRR